MKIGILISGRGSNMVAIADAVARGEIPDSTVAVVISDKADAAGLEKARDRGIETVVVERRGRTRADHDADIIAELQKRGVELVCLAGYMRLLSPSFVQAFPDKIINIHPSLLPDFPGLDAQQQAFDAGVKVTGCTVHYVDELLDHGPIVLQQWVPVEEGDSVSSLSERILKVEHRIFVEAVQYLAREWNTATDPGFHPNYKVLKSLAHNFTHSYVGWNWEQVEEIKQVVRQNPSSKISIRWFPPSLTHPELSAKVREGVQSHVINFIRPVQQIGAVLWSIREFRSDFFLAANHQMILEGVITDNRGKTHSARVYEF